MMTPGTSRKKTLYKSHIFHDSQQTLDAPFVMFYNAKQKGDWIERIGIAVSDDMLHSASVWRRCSGLTMSKASRAIRRSFEWATFG